MKWHVILLFFIVGLCATILNIQKLLYLKFNCEIHDVIPFWMLPQYDVILIMFYFALFFLSS